MQASKETGCRTCKADLDKECQQPWTVSLLHDTFWPSHFKLDQGRSLWPVPPGGGGVYVQLSLRSDLQSAKQARAPDPWQVNRAASIAPHDLAWRLFQPDLDSLKETAGHWVVLSVSVPAMQVDTSTIVSQLIMHDRMFLLPCCHAPTTAFKGWKSYRGRTWGTNQL